MLHCTICQGLWLNCITIDKAGKMRRPDPRHESGTPTSITAWLPVLAAMAVMVTGCVSTFLVLQLDEFRPKVGDIIAFRPGSQDGDMWQMTVPATVVNRPATM